MEEEITGFILLLVGAILVGSVLERKTRIKSHFTRFLLEGAIILILAMGGRLA
jgi:hypothetical protein